MSTGRDTRSLRIPQDVWDAAQQKAREVSAARGERVTVNALVVEFLRKWSARSAG
jgi:hypothetical protein